MKAIAFTTPGTPDVLALVDLPEPTPGPEEILLRVQAAGVNPTDTLRRSSGRDDDPSPKVPGMDAAGVVEAIGPSARTDLEVGDAAMAIVVPEGQHGAYSSLVALPAESVARIPDGASVLEAATLPMNGLTARLALDTLGLAPGSTIAVTGAAGALGGYCVQLGKADGLTVVADASEADERLVEALGADHVLRRGPGFAEAVRGLFPDGVDGIVDGAVQLEEIVPAAADGASVITIRGAEGEQERGVTFVPVWVVDYQREHARLDTLRQQVEAGVLTLRVADGLPAEDAAEAHRRLEAGGVRGRLVLEF